MKISEQICDRISASSLIGRYVDLKQGSGDNYIGLCPFHQEKTPSFTINDQKQFYYCFGCGEHGNVISFLMKFLGMKYGEALGKLATEIGIELPAFTKAESDNYIDNKNVITTYYKILKTLSEFYTKILYSNDNSKAFEYLKFRGLSNDTIKQYSLGYSPISQNIVYNFLINECKFKVEDVVACGALYENKNGNNKNNAFNHFAGRIIFPIHNRNGNVIAFGGRILDDIVQQNTNTNLNQNVHQNLQQSKSPKYLNSADTKLFNKGRNLYGLHFANQWLLDTKYALRMNKQLNQNTKINDIISNMVNDREMIVVEGYMDVIGLSNVGIGNAIAPLGTAIKIEQIQTLWQFTNAPIICMDNDTAGKNSMLRLAKLVMPHIDHNKTLKFFVMDKAKDPADFVQIYGADKFYEEINNKKQHLASFVFNTLYEITGEFETPEQKVAFYRELTFLTDNIKNIPLKTEYNKYFYKMFKDKFDGNIVGIDGRTSNINKYENTYTNKYGNKYVDKYQNKYNNKFYFEKDRYWLQRIFTQQNTLNKSKENNNVFKFTIYDKNNNAESTYAEDTNVENANIENNIKIKTYNKKLDFILPHYVVNIFQILFQYPNLLLNAKVHKKFTDVDLGHDVATELQQLVLLKLQEYDDVINATSIVSNINNTNEYDNNINIDDVMNDIHEHEVLFRFYQQLLSIKILNSSMIDGNSYDNRVKMILQAFNKYEAYIIQHKVVELENMLKKYADITDVVDSASAENLEVENTKNNKIKIEMDEIYNYIIHLKKIQNEFVNTNDDEWVDD